ncbi:MAG: hypothetical protein HND46_02300 [Chloroflexi bacterium]|nr:hypothetical protein [Chloroflexota bacterium]NOG62226.1 hypothetical protein [Chloroflexota bacterium]
MKLPHLENLLVPKAKITEYLLSDTHKTGKHKAVFFKHFGFSQDEWEVLAQALSQHAQIHEVTTTQDTRFGVHYVVEGELETPLGRRPRVRVVWAIDYEADIPRLISAYPLDEEE